MGLGFRDLGFRDLGFRGLGFRVYGVQGLAYAGIWGLAKEYRHKHRAFLS